KEYLDDLRRGSPDDLLVPTSSLFNELATYAPSCLTGPMPPTAQNIVNYATFFDVAPGCPHTTWQSGPLAGQPIDHTALGGVDETLWLMNASRAKYQATYGSGPTEAQLIAAASTTAQQSNLASLAQRFGRPDLQATVNSLGTVSGAIANDPGHSTVIHY
ncbi:MAG TPA: hypothetical protein VKT80_10530, partial [Chloroflexota bacterium]|nr:hypothetical protein [Chloroflexota bacterium]